jgi:hypothetical protein
MMKLVFRFPLQKGQSRDENYEVPYVPPVGQRILGNNKLVYQVQRIIWEMDVDKKQCAPVVLLEIDGEWDPEERKRP